MFINRPQQANNVHQPRSMFDNRPAGTEPSIFSYEDNPILAFQLNTLKNQPKLFSNPPPLSNYFSNNDPPNPTTTNQKLATMPSVLQAKGKLLIFYD